MKFKTDVLTTRFRRSLLAKAALLLLVVCLLHFEDIFSLQGNTGGAATTRFHLKLLLAVFALSFVVDYVHLYRPYRAVRRRENEILHGKNVENGLALPYVYSPEGRLLEREFSKLYDRKSMLEQSMQQSQYFALLNQINPHFLYNALDAIRSDALIAGEFKIADTIEALSTYFAYTISNLDQLATLAEELEHVKDYFAIQKYRFEDRLDMNIVNQTGVQPQELFIPRLTLQPIVENAIGHGLAGRQKKGTVTIELMQTSEHLIINVMDDGVGMEEEALTQLNDRLQDIFTPQPQARKKTGGIALRNVNSRIRMLFGDDYGIRLYSTLGAGTTARVLLPNVLREDIDEKRILEDL